MNIKIKKMKKIKITYAGRHDNGGKVLSNLYYTEDDRRLIFSGKMKEVAIGYKLECIEEGDGQYSGFTPINEKADQDFIDENVTRDRAVYELFRTKQLTKKIPPNEYDKFIKNLKIMTSPLSYAERKALITKILLEIL